MTNADYYSLQIAILLYGSTLCTGKTLKEIQDWLISEYKSDEEDIGMLIQAALEAPDANTGDEYVIKNGKLRKDYNVAKKKEKQNKSKMSADEEKIKL